MTKQQILSLVIIVGAFLDTLYGILAENQGLLIEFGISPKVTKVVMFVGLIITAVSKSITAKPVKD